jgi:hypothetical protein
MSSSPEAGTELGKSSVQSRKTVSQPSSIYTDMMRSAISNNNFGRVSKQSPQIPFDQSPSTAGVCRGIVFDSGRLQAPDLPPSPGGEEERVF